MKRRHCAAAICCLPVLPLSGPALADADDDSWTCRQAGIERQVTLYYPQAPAPLPCRVYYSKPDENALPRALWRARSTDGFCARKARELVERLQSSGWGCTSDS